MDKVKAKGILFINGGYYKGDFDLTIIEMFDFLNQEKYLDLSYTDIFIFFEENRILEDVEQLIRIDLENNVSILKRNNKWVLTK